MAGFEIEPGTPVKAGQIIGWVEGFKAISDLYCIAEGVFDEPNPLLKKQIELMNKDPYGKGWVYKARGSPDSRCLDVQAYIKLLDLTIDRILEKQKQGPEPAPEK